MRIVLISLVLLSSLVAFSQETESFYLFKSDETPTSNLKEAFYIQHVKKVNDTCFVSSYYNYVGPMIRQETFKDYDLTVPHGRFVWYRANGSLDSSGLVYNGKKDGWWEYTEPDSGKLIRSEWYDKGKLLEKTDYFNKRRYYNDGRVEDLDQPKDTSTKKDSVVQIEATQKGGMKAWKQYLEKNINTPQRFIHLYSAGTRLKVIVNFRIEKDGTIGQIYLRQSAEFSVDMEAVRVISNGPRWIPAMQNGKPVIYRQTQTITFDTD